MIPAITEAVSSFIMIAALILGFIYIRKGLSNYFEAKIPIILASAIGAIYAGMYSSILIPTLVIYLQGVLEIIKTVRG